MQTYRLMELRSTQLAPQTPGQPVDSVVFSNSLALPVLAALLVLLIRGGRGLAISCYLRVHRGYRVHQTIIRLQRIITLERILTQNP